MNLECNLHTVIYWIESIVSFQAKITLFIKDTRSSTKKMNWKYVHRKTFNIADNNSETMYVAWCHMVMGVSQFKPIPMFFEFMVRARFQVIELDECTPPPFILQYWYDTIEHVWILSNTFVDGTIGGRIVLTASLEIPSHICVNNTDLLIKIWRWTSSNNKIKRQTWI